MLLPIAAGDKRTAQDNHTFLKNWFKRFPHLQKNPFWISGESYAGACVFECEGCV